MARIRTIKPEFWTDEKVVTLSPLARLFFIGIWNFVDEEGRAEFSPLRLKMQILPADTADVSELIGEIQRQGLITIYEIGGKEYLQVLGFAKHQKSDTRYPSKLPPPPSAADSRPLPGKEKGKEREKEEIGADAPNHVGFSGRVIKLTKDDFEKWAAANPYVELQSYLIARDAYLWEQPAAERKRWYVSTSADLRNKNMQAKQRDGPKNERYRPREPKRTWKEIQAEKEAMQQ